MVIKNTVYNLLGLGLPLLVALGSMPILIHSLGDARFGVLTLIWAVVSYFGLFDLGLGRALTQQLSVLIAENREQDVPALVYTSLLLLTGLGFGAGVIMWCGATWGAHHISYQGDINEIVGAIRIMAIAMPFIVLTSGLRGILEAKSAFKIINLIRLPMGIFTFIGPLAVVLWYKNDLVLVTLVLTLGRVIACAVHAYYAIRALPGFLDERQYNKKIVKTLLASGGWMTVSNIISPLMGYLDRFLIGVTISTAAVAYYVTPNEMITKIWIIPSALTAVLLPRFAINISGKNDNSAKLYKQAVALLFFTIYPLTLILALFSNEILQVWVGPIFADKSYIVMQIFAFGILINCMAHIPFILIQSAGRAKTTAMIHVIEFIPFAIVLWLFSKHFGILGASLAWLLRMIIDTGVLFVIAGRIIEKEKAEFGKLLFLSGFVVASFLASALSMPLIRAFVFPLSCGVVFSYAWFFFASKEERAWIKTTMRLIKN